MPAGRDCWGHLREPQASGEYVTLVPAGRHPRPPVRADLEDPHPGSVAERLDPKPQAHVEGNSGSDQTPAAASTTAAWPRPPARGRAPPKCLDRGAQILPRHRPVGDWTTRPGGGSGPLHGPVRTARSRTRRPPTADKSEDKRTRERLPPSQPDRRDRQPAHGHRRTPRRAQDGLLPRGVHRRRQTAAATHKHRAGVASCVRPRNPTAARAANLTPKTPRVWDGRLEVPPHPHADDRTAGEEMTE